MVEAGNHAIDIELRRHRHGIRVRIHTMPEVEAFFEQWSSGLQERPSVGRLWKPIPDETLNLWTFGMGNMGPSTHRPYSLVHSGLGFFIEGGYPNLSFLRLVGVSNPDGRSLIVEAVMGRSEITQLGQRLSEACNMFYGEYLQPVNVRAVVSVFTLPNAA